MLTFSEIFEFSKEKFRKTPILKEFEWFEWFEWFGPSPIEPFNSGLRRRASPLCLPARPRALRSGDQRRGTHWVMQPRSAPPGRDDFHSSLVFPRSNFSEYASGSFQQQQQQRKNPTSTLRCSPM